MSPAANYCPRSNGKTSFEVRSVGRTFTAMLTSLFILFITQWKRQQPVQHDTDNNITDQCISPGVFYRSHYDAVSLTFAGPFPSPDRFSPLQAHLILGLGEDV